jgi:catechol 2,3-dioxygenase-like lactoylglutathione lyase family enzyme
VTRHRTVSTSATSLLSRVPRLVAFSGTQRVAQRVAQGVPVRVAGTALLVGVVSTSVTPVAAQLAPLNEVGVTYGHLHFNVADVDVHRRLWVEHFGGVATGGPVAAVWLPGTLMMFNARESSGGSQGSAIDHIGFKVREYDALVSGWRVAGYEVEREFVGGEGARNAYLVAPDGIRVEIQEDPTIESVAESYHVHFFVSDAEGLRDRYIDWFGATPRVRGSIQATADVPGMNLSFSEVPRATEGTQGRSMDHIGFEIEGLEAVVAAMEADGVVFDVPYRMIASLDIAVAFFTDPSGVYVELTEGLGSYR